MDRIRKFGEQTSRILEFKHEGLDFYVWYFWKFYMFDFRYWLRDIDMNVCDYDGRTALHLASAEGKKY